MRFRRSRDGRLGRCKPCFLRRREELRDTHVPAVRKWTKSDDGLSMPWEGRVWMNPPFSRPEPWVDKFIAHRNGVCYPVPSGGLR